MSEPRSRVMKGRQPMQELPAASAQYERGLAAQLQTHRCQTMCITGLLLIGTNSFVNPLQGNSFGNASVSWSRNLTSSRSKLASNRVDFSRESRGSAQSVHSRAMLKLPHSSARRMRVSIPPARFVSSTGNRCPLSGWNGWQISAHPKGEKSDCAVSANRFDSGIADRADGEGQGQALQQWKVDMHVEGLGLEAGKAVGDDLESGAHSVEMIEAFLETKSRRLLEQSSLRR
jgi:hypothetical protein